MNTERLTELQAVCHNVHLPLGEALLMINRMSGHTWATLPDVQLDEWKEFFINNSFRKTEILDAGPHAACMAYPGEFGDQYRLYYQTKGKQGRKMCDKANFEAFFATLNFAVKAI